MNLPFEKKISTLEDSKRVANNFSTIIKNSDVIIFNGNLGSGKTTIIKMICDNFGIVDASSPTFSIVNEYIGEKKIYHFDFYRIRKIDELYDIGFEEYLNDQHAVVFIEWGNLMPEILPINHYELEISFSDNNERKIKITEKK